MGNDTFIDSMRKSSMGLANWIRVWTLYAYHTLFVPEFVHRRSDNTIESMRFTWGSFSPCWGLKLEYHAGMTDGDREDMMPMLIVAMFWGVFFINLPWKHLSKYSEQPYCDPDRYGFYVVHDAHDKAIAFLWRARCWLYDFPWRETQVLHEIRLKDGTWGVVEKGQFAFEYAEENADKTTHDYEYTLSSGEVQKRKATIYQERRTLRWYWFQWLPINSYVLNAINITFDAEVGEKSGSWKGGCIGCAYEMKPGETPYETLRRMERERKF